MWAVQLPWVHHGVGWECRNMNLGKVSELLTERCCTTGDCERMQRICRFLHRSERFRRELGRQAGFSFAVKVRIGRADTTT